MKKFGLSTCFVMLISMLSANNTSLAVEGENPTVYVDFDNCISWFNGYNEDYSEFTGVTKSVETCTQLELAGPGYVYRNNGKKYTHSCTPGIDSASIGMCISSLDECDYMAGDSTALLFDVRVIPGTNGTGSLESISFYEQAPSMFTFSQGQSGINNYPTKLGIRVLIGSHEIFREDNIQTSRNWELLTLDFSEVASFTVTETTVFRVEILPYCLIGNGSQVSAWDIDNLTITGGCNSLNPGFIKVIGNINTCMDDSISRLMTFEAEDAIGTNLQWIITDQNGNILFLPDTNVVDFDTLGNGLFGVYHLAYGNEIFGLEVGRNVAALTGCFELSNRIVITNNKLVAGALSVAGSTDGIIICSGDAVDNIINVSLNGEVGTQTSYLLLDKNSNILQVSNSNEFDFSNLVEDNYSILAITHNGQLLNAAPGVNIDMIGGCIAISNAIVINKNDINAGILTLDQTEFCVGDGSLELLNAQVTNSSGAFTSFIITDADSTILSSPSTLPINLDLAPAGQCLLWHIVSNSEINIIAGDAIGDIDATCYDLSSPVAFTRTTNVAGLISLSDSTTSIVLCVSDAIPDIIDIITSGSISNQYQFIATDSLNVIIEISDVPTLDLTNFAVGNCRIWGVAHDGTAILTIGQTLATVLTTNSCIDLTANFIEVFRVDDGPECVEVECIVDGGFIDLFGSHFCVGDGIPDVVTGDIINAQGPVMQIVLTNSDSIVIDTFSSLSFDVDGAGSGTCIVWNLASLDSINVIMGSHINDITSSCFDLSEGVSFTRTLNTGGLVGLFNGGFTIELCVGDGISDELGFVTNGSGVNYKYIVTDTFNVIVDLPTSNVIDFENAGPGICRVWGLAHNSTYNQIIGDTLELPTTPGACFDFSDNFIEITRLESGVSCGAAPCIVNGGFIDLFASNYCIGDGMADFVTGDIQGALGTFMQVIVTDADSVIIGLPTALNFDVESSDPGTCIVWNLASTEMINLVIGTNINDIQGNCFDLSPGAAFTRTENNAGSISLNSGDTTAVVCVNDNLQNNLAFVNFGGIVNSYKYVVTDSLNVTLGLSTGSSFNFDPLPLGTCFVWGVSYTGTLLLTIGDTLGIDIGASGCFDISNNFVSVTKENCTTAINGGIISLINGSVEYCPGDTTLNALISSPVLVNQTGARSNVLATGNIDNDNFADVIIAYDNIVWLEYDGDQLLSQKQIKSGGLPNNFFSDIKVFDIDNDGDNDIVASDSIVSSVFILNNDGLGNFTESVLPDAAAQVLRIFNIDFNNDNATDIITFSSNPGAIKFYSNNGSGGFSLLQTESPLANMRQLEIGDIDGNAELDLVIAHGSNTSLILNPISTNAPPVSIDVAPGIQTMKLVDLNNDGTLELVLMQNNNAWQYEINSTGMLSKTQIAGTHDATFLEIVDYDANGYFDLLSVSDNLIDFYINENGVLVKSNIPVQKGGKELAFFDIDNDGVNEIFVGSDPSAWIEQKNSYVFNFLLSGTSLGTKRWVLTDVNDKILKVFMGNPPLTLDLNPLGEFHVYHVTYSLLMGLTAGKNLADLQGEFDLSNAIVLNSTTCQNACPADGGMVSTQSGMSLISVCVGDGDADIISVSTSSTDALYQYVVTDTTGLVLDLPNNNEIDFENSGVGVCHIYGVSYEGSLLLEIGENINSDEIATGCSEISDNFLTVERVDDGGPCGNVTVPELTLVVNRISEVQFIFDIKNISKDTIDVTDYWICRDNNMCNQIGQVITECGEFGNIMAPGDIKGLNLSLDRTDGELAIFTSDSFNNGDDLIHYVEWGASGHAFSSLAVSKGLWTNGDFVEAVASGQSLYFDGHGFSSEDWNEGNTNLCGDLIIEADIVFSRVGDSGQVIDLENIGSDTVDINDYIIRQGINSYRVGDLVVECGEDSKILRPRKRVGLVVIPMSNAEGELALFTSEANATFGVVSDYVQWGSNGGANESLAVASGVWASGRFVPTISAGQSIYYDGDGNSITDWEEGFTTICGELAPNRKRINAMITPNPATDQMAIEIIQTQKPISEMVISDANGKIVLKAGMNMEAGDIYRMNVHEMATGLYFLRLKSKNAVVTERFLIVR